MAASTFTWTAQGLESLTKYGAFNTLQQFTISDANQVYDVIPPADLTKGNPGGSRSIITQSKCGKVNVQPISKQALTDDQSDLATKQLNLKIESIECDNTFSVSNLNCVVDLKTYLNYLTTISDYNFNNKAKVPIVDNVQATIQQLNPSTYNYDDVGSYDNLNVTYSFNDVDSMNNYKSFNSYLMKINSDGTKTVNMTTEQRFGSPFSLFFHTDPNSPGKGENLILGMNPVTWGYGFISSSDPSTTHSITNFMTISQVEAMTPNQIDSAFKSLLPACKISTRAAEDDIYYLTDLNGSKQSSVDNTASMMYRFQNRNNEYLWEGLSRRAKTFIESNFVEDKTTGIFSKQMSLKVSNTIVNGTQFDQQRIIGGEYNITFNYDPSETGSNYNDIVKLI
jgi:hypothetical protein